MARKLKTYQTSIGFFDLAVATPSMKAALEAWGAQTNLFHQGLAKETDDPAIVAATLARPGVVLRGGGEPAGAEPRRRDAPRRRQPRRLSPRLGAARARCQGRTRQAGAAPLSGRHRAGDGPPAGSRPRRHRADCQEPPAPVLACRLVHGAPLFPR